MNALHERLAAGAGPDATAFSVDDIRRRVGQRARRRRWAAVGAAVVLVVFIGLAGVLVRDVNRSEDLVVAGSRTEEASVAGRWELYAISAVTTHGDRTPVLTLSSSGELSLDNGCSPSGGRWAVSRNRLRVTKLPPTDGCPGPAGVVATLLEQVLGSGPIIGDFDGEPDTLRLTSGDDFVAFRRLPDEPVVTRLRQVPVTGTVQGEPWQLIVVPAGPAGSDAMCLEVRLARGALKSCSDWEEVIAASAYDLLGDRVIAGSTTPDVASARVRFADDTEPMVIPTVVADDYDRRFFAATITSDAPIAEVMALDAAGNDLEPVADLGGGVLETGN